MQPLGNLYDMDVFLAEAYRTDLSSTVSDVNS